MKRAAQVVAFYAIGSTVVGGTFWVSVVWLVCNGGRR